MSIYDKPAPFDKPQTFDGLETLVPIVAPSVVNSVRAPYGDADDHSVDAAMPWAQSGTHQAPTVMPWGKLATIRGALHAAWADAQAQSTDAAIPWGKLTPSAEQIVSEWAQAQPYATRAGMPWDAFVQRLAASLRAPWRTPDAYQFDTTLRWAQAARESASSSALWRSLAARGAYVAIPWGGHAQRVDNPTTIPFINPPDTGDPLVFPDLPVYVMIPAITAVVIAGGADMKPLATTVDEDVDSWCASLDMQIPAETFHLVNPGTNSSPVAIQVTQNGFAWNFIVESYSDNRKWGAKGYTVRGRSPSAVLADPNSPVRSLLQDTDYNIAQLADHEVTSTGWTMIWDAYDFLVPGGTWTYNDLTPIAAIQQLAQSIGAVVLTDPDALNLHVKPRYPILPWNWASATPYAVLPAALLDSASGDWRGGSNPNGIYVYSKNSTSGAFVRITGSGGAEQMPMVVHELLVENNAQARRGEQELAKAGRMKQEQITIPLFPAPASPSLIPLQALLEVTDETGTTWRGQVMRRQITGTRNGGALSVRQVLTVERQFRS